MIANEALKQYDIQSPHLEFIRHNENLTYSVTDGISGIRFLLRVHMPVEWFSRIAIQHTFSALQAEMRLLEAIREGTDIAVQKPVPTRSGEFICRLTNKFGQDPLYATMLTWIDGHPMDRKDPEWERHRPFLPV